MNMLEICQVCITSNMAFLEHIKGDKENSWKKHLHRYEYADPSTNGISRTRAEKHRRGTVGGDFSVLTHLLRVLARHLPRLISVSSCYGV
jgi:hypothetical protein